MSNDSKDSTNQLFSKNQLSIEFLTLIIRFGESQQSHAYAVHLLIDSYVLGL